MMLPLEKAAVVLGCVRVAAGGEFGDTTIPNPNIADTLDPTPPTPHKIPALPISTVEAAGKTLLQKTYKSISFNILKPDTPGPFYLVTKGLQVGVFSGLCIHICNLINKN